MKKKSLLGFFLFLFISYRIFAISPLIGEWIGYKEVRDSSNDKIEVKAIFTIDGKFWLFEEKIAGLVIIDEKRFVELRGEFSLNGYNALLKFENKERLEISYESFDSNDLIILSKDKNIYYRYVLERNTDWEPIRSNYFDWSGIFQGQANNAPFFLDLSRNDIYTLYVQSDYGPLVINGCRMGQLSGVSKKYSPFDLAIYDKYNKIDKIFYYVPTKATKENTFNIIIGSIFGTNSKNVQQLEKIVNLPMTRNYDEVVEELFGIVKHGTSEEVFKEISGIKEINSYILMVEDNERNHEENLLMVASKYNSDEKVIDILLHSGIRIDKFFYNKNNEVDSLQLAAEYNSNIEIIKLLFNSGKFEYDSLLRAIKAAKNNPNQEIEKYLKTALDKKYKR